MTTREIVALVDGRSNGQSAWMAKCPAHVDRRPSLHVCEGRDGRVLVNCFAGCEPSAIMDALGLDLRDLFDSERLMECRIENRRYQRDGASVERALQAELERIVAAESARLGFDVAVTTRHINALRRRARLFGCELRALPVPWYEVDPHCADPAWRMCVDQALIVLAARGDVGIYTLRAAIVDLPKTQARAIKIARYLQRSLSQVWAA